MDRDEHSRVGERLTRARKESGLTQAQLAEMLGVTTRSVQNYESGAIVPWRHLSNIETITRKRRGWLLREEDGKVNAIPSEATVATLLDTMEQHQQRLVDHLRILRRNTERMRKQRETIRTSRNAPPA